MPYHVLIADDHPLFREALASIISMTLPECSLQQATDYSEAQQALSESTFDLAFVDLNMPDSNGLTDLALLKKMHPELPIVVVSAHEEAEVIRTCIGHGAAGYIIKSSGPNEIKNAIQAILNGETYLPANIDLQVEAHDADADAGD